MNGVMKGLEGLPSHANKMVLWLDPLDSNYGPRAHNRECVRSDAVSLQRLWCLNRSSFTSPQMGPFSLYGVLLLTRADKALFKSSALYSE